MAELIDRLRPYPDVDLVARSEGLLAARKNMFIARLPESGRPLHLVAVDPARNRLVLVCAVPWCQRLPALVGLLGDARLKKLCRCPGVAEVQVHVWRKGASGRLRCDTLTLTAADYSGRARGPARGRWAPKPYCGV
jgi:hypothetical protein